MQNPHYVLAVLAVVVTIVVGYVLFLRKKAAANSQCQKMQEKYPDWPKGWLTTLPGRSFMDIFTSAGMMQVEDWKYKLTDKATDEVMYDLGYLTMCALAPVSSNYKNMYPNGWKYGDMEGGVAKQPLGTPRHEDIPRFTQAMISHRKGYIQAQKDRGVRP